MIALRLLPIIAVLLFILLQKINIRVKATDRVSVKINFNILAIELLNEKTKKKNIKQIIRHGKSIGTVIRPMRYLLSRCSVEAKCPQNQFLPFQNENIYNIALLNFLFAFIKTHSKSLKISDNDASFHSGVELIFNFSSYHLIISALFFLYYIVKNNIKRVAKNV